MTVNILKNGTRFECGTWRDICRLLAVAKTIAKITLERTKGHLENLIDRKQTGFRSLSSCTDNINTLWIIVQFKFPLYLHFVYSSRFSLT